MQFNVQCCTLAIFADLTQKWRRSSSSFSWNGTTSSQTWSHPSSTCVTRRASQTWPWPATARLAKHTKWSCLLVVPTSNRYLRCENTQTAWNTHKFNSRAFAFAGESIQAPHHHPQRRAILSSAGDPRVHVRWWGQRISGPAASLPQDGWAVESERTCRGTAVNQERALGNASYLD